MAGKIDIFAQAAKATAAKLAEKRAAKRAARPAVPDAPAPAIGQLDLPGIRHYAGVENLGGGTYRIDPHQAMAVEGKRGVIGALEKARRAMQEMGRIGHDYSRDYIPAKKTYAMGDNALEEATGNRYITPDPDTTLYLSLGRGGRPESMAAVRRGAGEGMLTDPTDLDYTKASPHAGRAWMDYLASTAEGKERGAESGLDLMRRIFADKGKFGFQGIEGLGFTNVPYYQRTGARLLSPDELRGTPAGGSDLPAFVVDEMPWMRPRDEAPSPQMSFPDFRRGGLVGLRRGR